jgi:curved DNA-binding protein CbpA
MPYYSSTYSGTSDTRYEEQGSSTSESPSLPPNPYSVLGVSENAEHSEIRKAYLKLILRYHPDKVDNGERGTSVEEFYKVKEAYDLITDEARLAEYKEQKKSEPKSQTRAPRSGASQSSASTSETSTNRHGYSSLERNSKTFPLRPFYKRCEICLGAYCYDVHRWFTRYGYINDLTSRGFSLKGARVVAEEHYGEWNDFHVCEVCYERDCAHGHRLFTREGFVWDQLKVLGDLSDDAILAADIQAREEFGDADFSSIYGGRNWSGRSSSQSYGTTPWTYTYGCFFVSQGRTRFYESTSGRRQQRHDDSKYDSWSYRTGYVVPSYETRYDWSYRTRYDS